VLDGGMDGWRAAGFETTMQMAEPHPSSLKIKPRKELFISADELNARIAKGEVVPLDTRSDDEYFGKHKRSARAGAIPGAVHLEWLTYLDDQGRFKPPSQLGAMFKSAGITPDKAIVPY
jgi:thiosulfate/3-mercaptopyruvate sulfurtransferase